MQEQEQLFNGGVGQCLAEVLPCKGDRAKTQKVSKNSGSLSLNQRITFCHTLGSTNQKRGGLEECNHTIRIIIVCRRGFFPIAKMVHWELEALKPKIEIWLLAYLSSAYTKHRITCLMWTYVFEHEQMLSFFGECTIVFQA